MNTPAKLFALLFLSLSLASMVACSSGSDDDDGGATSESPPATNSPTASTVELAGTSWRILSVMRGSTTLSADGRELNIDFGSDGRVSGNSGCNSFFGPYRQSGDRVEIDSLGSTLIGCDGETALLESAVVSALSVNGTISRVDDSIAMLSSSEASIQLQRR